MESVFSKMACAFLRHIRDDSKEELKEIILVGSNEFNAVPVAYKWEKVDFAIPLLKYNNELNY